jgi:hypothetical protein
MPVVRSHGFHPWVVAGWDPPEVCYAIWDGAAVKVGKCRGSPLERLKDLQVGNSREL